MSVGQQIRNLKLNLTFLEVIIMLVIYVFGWQTFCFTDFMMRKKTPEVRYKLCCKLYLRCIHGQLQKQLKDRKLVQLQRVLRFKKKTCCNAVWTKPIYCSFPIFVKAIQIYYYQYVSFNIRPIQVQKISIVSIDLNIIQNYMKIILFFLST